MNSQTNKKRFIDQDKSISRENFHIEQKFDESNSIDEHLNSSLNEFNVYRVYNSFILSLKEPNNIKSPINTRHYINGYRELLRFD